MKLAHFTLACLATLQAHHTFAQTTPAAPVVGEATLVIGQARIVAADGASTPAHPGSPVRVGDRVETQAGGHVYLRFVDGASLSVRPQSRMLIESYSHNPQQPQLGAIKFKLDEGAARSITGAWGEAARERFRLNTPVAAIGVRGTDFTVRSEVAGTTATVYTGAIVLAPLANGCATSVGPCQSSAATLLSADMRGQMLELSSRDSTPLMVAAAQHINRPFTRPAGPAVQPTAPENLVASAGNRPPELGDSRHEASPAVKVLDSETRGAAVAVLEVPAPAPTTPALAPVTPPAADIPALAPPPVALVPEPTPPAVVAEAPPEIVPVPVPVGPPQVKQLSWARYDWTPGFKADAFVKTFAEAVAAGQTKLVGNGAYALMKTTETGLDTASLPNEAVVNFRLASATAHLLPPAVWEKPQTVAVLGGNLTVDFSRTVFQTALAMQGTQIGYQSMNASGVITPTGAMQATAGDATLMGAITTDRQEAAYAFEKLLPAGALRGVTLWGR